MVHRLGGIGALSSHNCKLQPLLGCMLVQDLFTTQFVPNRDATPTSRRRVNDSGRHPIPVGAVVVHRQSGDKLGQLRFRHCGSGGHRIRKRTHGARTVRARCAHGSGNTPKVRKHGVSVFGQARVSARGWGVHPHGTHRAPPVPATPPQHGIRPMTFCPGQTAPSAHGPHAMGGSENQGVEKAANALRPKEPSAAQDMDIMQLNSEVSHTAQTPRTRSAHSTHLLCPIYGEKLREPTLGVAWTQALRALGHRGYKKCQPCRVL